MWTSSSSSTSTASSTSSSSPTPTPKTMEEVWKDITLAASDLHLHPSSHGVILQDFFSRDQPPSAAASPGFSASPPPPPPTMLNLNSAPDHFSPLLFQPHHHHLQPFPHPSATFDAVVPEGGGATARKRVPEFDRSSGDRRHKRMIKNRESAARSRARKQAYTNELELEVANLLQENARLRKQQEQSFRDKEAAAELQKRKSLHRSSTAPF